MTVASILIGLLFLLVGVILFASTLNEREMGKQSRTWPCVEGTILHSSAVTHVDEGHLTYYSKVVYQYVVGGRIFSSDRVAIGARSGGSQESVRRWSERYPVGRQVVVYHNPRNPAEAVLERNSAGSEMSTFMLAALFLLSGILLLFFSVISAI